MSLLINLPYAAWGYKISGVYRIDFQDGSFYIGCSSHLRHRADGWSSIFKRGVHNKTVGSKMMEKIIELKMATLSIIELCAPSDIKDKELFYLKKNEDNALMLSHRECAWKPVLQYTKDGFFVKKHVSIQAAARYMKSPIGRIQDVLNKNRQTHKDMKFIYESEYCKPKRIYIPHVRKNKRWVLAFDSTGSPIGRFKKIKQAADEFKCSVSSVSKVLSGKQKTAQGYTFEYEN